MIMRYPFRAMAAGLAFLFALENLASAQIRPKGTIVVPKSSIEKPGDAGKRAHTNYRYFVPDGGFKSPQPQAKGAPPYSGYFYETPASLGCIYHLTVVPRKNEGCNPNVVTANPTGGGKAIAIVVAYGDGSAIYDLQSFSEQFGLPKPKIEVVYGNGIQPPPNDDWAVESALDIEWAHAMAPKAKIYLVEAVSNATSDLLAAEEVATNLVVAAGGGEVSNSWGSSEFVGETDYDSIFTTPGVVFFAAAGDAEGTIWPSVSPNVVSVGGTSISRNPLTGYFQEEYAWNSAGGGPSYIETRPSYQNGVQSIVGFSRGTPDVAADGDLNSGVWVFATTSGGSGWYTVGGTSVATPTWAGIVNSAGSFATSSQAELTTIYGNLGVASDFNDITLGSCSFYNGYNAVKGYDFCTGVGTPYGKAGK
jgi:subtilase family serine protease